MKKNTFIGSPIAYAGIGTSIVILILGLLNVFFSFHENALKENLFIPIFCLIISFFSLLFYKLSNFKQ